MKTFLVRSAVLIVAIIAIGLATVADAVAQRSVAITIDDLPVSSSRGADAAVWRRITNGLVSTLQRERVPAIGFVN